MGARRNAGEKCSRRRKMQREKESGEKNRCAKGNGFSRMRSKTQEKRYNRRMGDTAENEGVKDEAAMQRGAASPNGERSKTLERM